MVSQLTSILIGGGITLAGTLVVHEYQNYVESRRLQSALATEIELMERDLEELLLIAYILAESKDGIFDDSVIAENFKHIDYDEFVSKDVDEILDELKNYSPTKDPFSMQIYTANTDKLGRLSKGSASNVVKFYSNIDDLNRAIKIANARTIWLQGSFESDTHHLYEAIKSTKKLQKDILNDFEKDGITSRLLSF